MACAHVFFRSLSDQSTPLPSDSVDLTPLRFVSIAVNRSWESFRLQAVAHAGGTKKKSPGVLPGDQLTCLAIANLLTFTWTHLHLHEVVSDDTLDSDLSARIGDNYASPRIDWIVVAIAIVKNRFSRQAWVIRGLAEPVQCDCIGRLQRKRRVISLYAVAPDATVSTDHGCWMSIDW